MGLKLLAKITKSFIQKIPGFNKNAQFASAEGFAGDQKDFQIYGPCNEDFSPPNNTLAMQENFGRDAGVIVLHAYSNDSIEPEALPGERKLYSTNEAGDTIQASVFLKQDGSIIIDNGGITITANPSGLLEIEASGNIEITSPETIINGDLTVTGETDLQGSTTIETKSFLNHLHTGVQSGANNTGGVA